ncbi:MAG TPA: nuclear transport factor 2 family protein [Acidimicrobiales bacterium]|nr:nuclear transport factor 2 family protein [Acidimicrobiales bacterium]
MAAADCIDTFVHGLGSYDTDLLSTVCDPGMLHWSSLTRRERGLREFLAHLDGERALIEHPELTVRNRLDCGASTVLVVEVTGSLPGGTGFSVMVVLVVGVHDNRIVRVDEVADVSRARSLLTALRGLSEVAGERPA